MALFLQKDSSAGKPIFHVATRKLDWAAWPGFEAPAAAAEDDAAIDAMSA